MISALSLVAALASPAHPPAVVVPGVSLGGIALGTPEAELAKSGYAVGPGALEVTRKVGPYEVQLDAGKVVRVSLDLGPDLATVHIAGGPVTPKSPEDMAIHLGPCGPLQINTGGNIITCTAGAIVGQHMGGLMVSVVPPMTATDEPVCAGYLVPGAEGVRLPLEAGKAYCVGSRVVTTEIVQADVLGKLGYNTCQTQPNEGATVVNCPFQGVRFVFASPSGALARVEGLAQKQ